MSEKTLPPPQRRGIFATVTDYLGKPLDDQPLPLGFVEREVEERRRFNYRMAAVTLAAGIAAVTCLILAGMS